MKLPLIVAITGATGVVYGVELLRVLRDLGQPTHLILSEAAGVNLGIETDYTIPLTSNTQYVFRAYVDGDANGDQSAYSGDLTASTTNAECTQGFWKNHPEVWPASATPMLLGTVAYTRPTKLFVSARTRLPAISTPMPASRIARGLIRSLMAPAG